MAKVCFENYDPAFQKIARENDILVAGYNFGCGSSREQAATSILAKGISLVVAGKSNRSLPFLFYPQLNREICLESSFSEIFYDSSTLKGRF